MSFLRAARAALGDQRGLPWILVALILAGLSLSCNNTDKGPPSASNHNAYVTLPQTGSVLLLHINGANGTITLGAQTPATENTSPSGLALLPSKKFLYVANSRANTISIFSVASDATLALTTTPTPVSSSPDAMVIDPSGKYLLVTYNFSDTIDVFSIDAGSGALAEVPGAPFFANANPTQIIFTHSGAFVYVTNPGIGMVTGFSFAGGVLSPVPHSPAFSGNGAAALAVDGGDRFLYVANPSASNPPPDQATIGNISGFTIDPDSGQLTKMANSPFTASVGSTPSAITVDPGGRYVYAVTPGSSYSIWGFAITPSNGELTALPSSPFSFTGGGLFALIDPSGNFFYVGSQESKGVAGYTYNPSTGTPTTILNSPFSTGTPPGSMVLSE